MVREEGEDVHLKKRAAHKKEGVLNLLVEKRFMW